MKSLFNKVLSQNRLPALLRSRLLEARVLKHCHHATTAVHFVRIFHVWLLVYVSVCVCVCACVSERVCARVRVCVSKTECK